VTDEVRHALRALATDETAAPTAVETVDEADAALAAVEALATFVDDGGVDRLRRAIETADAAGEPALARRGRRTLATIERCRDAARDHFHSGRGTVLSPDPQGSER
jgi:IS5 family transposase